MWLRLRWNKTHEIINDLRIVPQASKQYKHTIHKWVSPDSKVDCVCPVRDLTSTKHISFVWCKRVHKFCCRSCCCGFVSNSFRTLCELNHTPSPSTRIYTTLEINQRTWYVFFMCVAIFIQLFSGIQIKPVSAPQNTYHIYNYDKYEFSHLL